MLGTGEPPPKVTVSPGVGVLAEIRVPAAIGFKRGSRPRARLPGLASAAIRLRLPLVSPYQVSPATSVSDRVCVVSGPTCIVILLHAFVRPLVLAHSGLAPEVENTVSVALRT